MSWGLGAYGTKPYGARYGYCLLAIRLRRIGYVLTAKRRFASIRRCLLFLGGIGMKNRVEEVMNKILYK